MRHLGHCMGRQSAHIFSPSSLVRLMDSQKSCTNNGDGSLAAALSRVSSKLYCLEKKAISTAETVGRSYEEKRMGVLLDSCAVPSHMLRTFCTQPFANAQAAAAANKKSVAVVVADGVKAKAGTKAARQRAAVVKLKSEPKSLIDISPDTEENKTMSLSTNKKKCVREILDSGFL